jgi:hypothetical protein
MDSFTAIFTSNDETHRFTSSVTEETLTMDDFVVKAQPNWCTIA